jgi:signal peptidase II
VTSQRLVAIFWSLSLGILAFGLDRGQKFFQVSSDCIGASADVCLARNLSFVPLAWTNWHGGEIVRVTDFFDYVLVWNTGISYGLLSSVPVAMLGVIMIVAIIALGIWWFRASTLLLQCGLALAIGGALSNALDRLLYGAVADFFHFHLGDHSFYIFNIADAAITLGVLLLILDMFGIGRGKTV